MGGAYTTEQLAKRWGCTAQTVRNMCHAGILFSFPVGKKKNHLRIPKWAVLKHEGLSDTGVHGASLGAQAEKHTADPSEPKIKLWQSDSYRNLPGSSPADHKP